jgi:hypothetical protein
VSTVRRYNQQQGAVPIGEDASLVLEVDGGRVEVTAPAWRFRSKGREAVQVRISVSDGSRNASDASTSSITPRQLSRLSSIRRSARFHVGQFHISVGAIEAKTTLNEKWLAKPLRAALIEPFLNMCAELAVIPASSQSCLPSL